MKAYVTAVRYFVSTLAVSVAFALVCLAQQASPPPARVQVAKEVPSDRIAGLIAEWTRAKDYTREYIDAMPEDGIGFKPAPDIRSFAEQMLHLADAHYFFVKGALGVDTPADAKGLEKKGEKSKAALQKTVADSYDFVIAQIKGLNLTKLDEQITFAPFGTKMTRQVALAKAFEHQTHHRGQTTIYLRMKGVKPPQEKLF